MTDPTFNRVIIEAPVRHGKSIFWSYIFPTWFKMTFPDKSVLLSSYSSTFSEAFTGRCRDLIAQHGKRAGIALDDSYKARNFFKLAGHDGSMEGIGAFGAISGKGFHLMIADDLVKDQEEANSPTIRNKLATWFAGDFMTRAEPGAKVVVVMSRRHPDDMTGRLMALNQDLLPENRWHVVTYKAIGDDGAALWPARFPVEKLRAIEQEFAALGMSYLFSSLYQQDPRGDPSGCEWPDEYFQGVFCDILPAQPYRFRVMSLDPAMGKNAKSGDVPALLYVLMDSQSPAHLWIEDSSMRVMPSSVVEDTAVAFMQQHKPDGFIVETNGFQELIAQNIARKAAEQQVAAPIYTRCSTENKEVRIRMALTPMLHQRRLHFRNTPSNRILVKQLQEFPTGAHDDGPDSLALATYLINQFIAGKRTASTLVLR